ncbi:hypothetical protein BIW11_02600 [Tropilaelaps mercedesae]|uniref:Uncharacterized protein n=1 Tax=Tropilaelaps mercedesae TaxID=418985 RepID=A0A1V9Y0B3_9ACAR|nr:hypothetical protein BIW11_02600 [Tropilaelaps mercedesae]
MHEEVWTPLSVDKTHIFFL